jgi:hypothetical protein
VRKPFATRARASSSSRSAHVDLSAHQAQGPGPIAGAPLALVGTGSKPELAASLRRAVRVRRLAGDERVGRSRRRSRGRRSLRLLPLSPLRSLALRGSFRLRQRDRGYQRAFAASLTSTPHPPQRSAGARLMTSDLTGVGSRSRPRSFAPARLAVAPRIRAFLAPRHRLNILRNREAVLFAPGRRPDGRRYETSKHSGLASTRGQTPCLPPANHVREMSRTIPPRPRQFAFRACRFG